MMSFKPMGYDITQGVQLRRKPPETIRATQLQLLKNHLRQAANGLYYKKIFNDLHFQVEDLNDLEDLRKLPLTSRQDLETHAGEIAPANIAVSDIVHTSGTTGEPLVVPYTAMDLRRLAYNEAIAFYGAGIRKNDRLLLTVTLDRCFIAGLAYYHGAVQLGSSVLRSGPGQPPQQWKLIDQFRPSILLGVPSFLLHLARWGRENGKIPEKSGIRAIVTIGEPIRDGRMQLTALGRLLEEQWQVPLYSSYGGTEMATGFTDCLECCGGHEHPELMLTEIVDEEGTVLGEGEAGEVVVTPLGVEGFPLVRLRTGDVARLHATPCRCGWNTKRLGPIEGRLSQRMKYKGTTLYPEMILQALQELGGADDCYIEVSENFDLSDEITVVIGADSNALDTGHIRDLLQARLRVVPRISIEPKGAVIDKTGKGKLRKPIRFFDHRHSSPVTADN